jgi:hypothetical protein
MKLSITTFLLLFATVTFSQKEITFEEMKTFTKGAFEAVEFDTYLAKDGHKYKIGDTLEIGRPSSNKSFAFILEGSGALTAQTNADVRVSGAKTIIRKIYPIGSKKAGFAIVFQTKGFCDLCPKYYITVEQAFATNELISLGMTKEKAIAKLKEAKDLLDLGIITKEDFEKLKLELTPIITGTN